LYSRSYHHNRIYAKNTDYYFISPSLKLITLHPREIDFVLDTIRGDNIERSLEVTKEGGIIIPIGLSEEAAFRGVEGYFIRVRNKGNDMEQKGTVTRHSQSFHGFP